MSRAVTASSAVPVLFDPVVVKNHKGCSSGIPDWLTAAKKRMVGDPELKQIVRGLESYFNKDQHRFAHFVDGGITDNLGLRSIFEMAHLAGGGEELLDYFGGERTPKIVFISVDASANAENSMGLESKTPGTIETINAMARVQLHRYNTATISGMNKDLQSWATQVRKDAEPVDAYFIRIGLDDVKDPVKRRFLNNIPTSFSLTDKQVDTLIETGRQLLRSNSEFQRLLSQIR